MRRFMVLGLALLFLSGCGSYYMITDPTSKNVFYTESVDQNKQTGAVKFKDAKTGASVNLQNSEVKEIPKEEFKAAVGKK
jgi:hypothetical protein